VRITLVPLTILPLLAACSTNSALETPVVDQCGVPHEEFTAD
jgi:hypothetical protein